MPKASEAPFALVDIVRCSKSWTTVDAGQCSQCSPTNGSPRRRRLAVPQAIGFRERSPPGRRRTWTSSRGSLPKNLIAAHPVQGSLADEGFGGTCSPAAPCAQSRRVTGRESQRAAEMLFLSGAVVVGWEGLTEDDLFYAYDGEEENQWRNPGDGDTKRR